jgi:hypothetical protein
MATYYVRTGGSDSNGGTDPNTDAWLTINKAIATHADGDTVDVGAGTFEMSANAAINSKTFYLRGAGTNSTIIDGLSTYYLRFYLDVANKTASLKNLTLQNLMGGYAIAIISIGNVVLELDSVRLKSSGLNYLVFSGYDGGSANTIIMKNSIYEKNNICNGLQALLFQINPNTPVDVYFYNNIIDIPDVSVGLGLFYNSVANSRFYIKNNIFSNTYANTQEFFDSDGDSGTLEIDSNCLYSASNPFTNIPTATNTTTSNPLFVDPSNGNFNLRVGDGVISPCIGAGILI